MTEERIEEKGTEETEEKVELKTVGDLKVAFVEEIRQNIPRAFSDDSELDELSGLDVKDPAKVTDMFVRKARGDCECPKHSATYRVFTAAALYMDELLSNRALEWSDRQRQEISRVFAELTIANVAFTGIASERKPDAKTIRLALSVLEDAGVAVIPASMDGPMGKIAALASMFAAVESARKSEPDEPADESNEE